MNTDYEVKRTFVYDNMVHMRSDKGKAFVLRSKGKSYREISAELGVAKSTLSAWFAGVDFSEAIRGELTKQAIKKSTRRLKTLSRVRGAALEAQYELAEKEARKELQLYRNMPLFTAALGIYWGEGDITTRHRIRVGSSDPNILRVFVAFLTELCGVQKGKICLVLYVYTH
ncbi:MAG: hypothetical protein AAFO91_07115, partial [Bacteroidota bacterium]